MLDGHHRRHAVPDIGAGKVGVLLLQDIQLPGVGIDHAGEHSLKTGQMRAAFRIVNIVAEAEDIFMEFVHILKRHFHGNPFAFTGKINDIADGFLRLIQILDKAHNAIRLVEFNNLRSLPPLVLKNNGKLGIQISSFMKAAFYFILFETGLFKNGAIG